MLELLESGVTPTEILRDSYPSLSEADIRAALHYAADLGKNQETLPVAVAAR